MGRRDEMAQDKLDCSKRALYKTIGENIEKRRKSRFNRKHRMISQEEIAAELHEKIGVSFDHSSISKKISGKQRFSILEAIALCDLLDCSLDMLCGIKEKNRDNEAAERYTGLSQESVRYLHSLDKKKRAILDSILNRDSGLDTILQDICDARAAAQDASFREFDVQLAIQRYNSSIKGHNETKRLYSADHSIKEESVYVPPKTDLELHGMKNEICNKLDLLQLQELKQENHKRNIRTVFERIMSNLIPSAKSQQFPDPEKLRKKYYEPGSRLLFQ